MTSEYRSGHAPSSIPMQQVLLLLVLIVLVLSITLWPRRQSARRPRTSRSS